MELIGKKIIPVPVEFHLPNSFGGLISNQSNPSQCHQPHEGLPNRGCLDYLYSTPIDRYNRHPLSPKSPRSTIKLSAITFSSTYPHMRLNLICGCCRYI